MNKSLIVAIISALALTAAGHAGEAGKDAGGRPRHKPHEMPLVPLRLLERLELTDAQQAQLQEIEAAFDKERDKLFAGKKEQLAALDGQAKAAREADNAAQLKEIRKQRHELMQPLGALHRQYLEKVRGLLTAEQRKTWEEARQEMKERRGKQRHGGPAGPPPPPE